MSFQVFNGISVSLLAHLAKNMDIRWEKRTTDPIKILRAESDAGIGKHDVVKVIRVIWTDITFSTPRSHCYSLSVKVLR